MTAPDDVRARFDLLPCPFCGEQPTWRPQGNDHTRSRRLILSCPGCRVQLTNAAIRHDFEWLYKITAEAWNRRAAHADLSGEVRDSTGRSAKDYAIEHAGYMARAATGLIAAVNDLELARQQFDEGEGTEDATDAAEQSLGDAISALRSCIYEFEKRRDRALAKLTQEKP